MSKTNSRNSSNVGLTSVALVLVNRAAAAFAGLCITTESGRDAERSWPT